MSRLMTSSVYAATTSRRRDHAVDDPFLYDEGAMMRLGTQQQSRELYVRTKLAGGYAENPFMPSPSKPKPAVDDSKVQLEVLKEQIKHIRAEKKKVLANGVKEVQSYMEQLKKEHESHAREMDQLRTEDANISAWFIAEVEKLKQQYKKSKKPLDEIISQVKAKIAENEGESVSSIQVTEVHSDCCGSLSD